MQDIHWQSGRRVLFFLRLENLLRWVITGNTVPLAVLSSAVVSILNLDTELKTVFLNLIVQWVGSWLYMHQLGLISCIPYCLLSTARSDPWVPMGMAHTPTIVSPLYDEVNIKWNVWLWNKEHWWQYQSLLAIGLIEYYIQ